MTHLEIVSLSWTEIMMLLLFAVLSEPRLSQRKTVILTACCGYSRSWPVLNFCTIAETVQENE